MANTIISGRAVLGTSGNLAKRIIPCLDIKDGRTVKGVNFIDIKDAGNPVSLALEYAEQGADELVFLDITATVEQRKTLLSLVNEVASSINIPFTVGGGIASVTDVELLLKNGADKVSINSAAIRRPNLIREISASFGSQCVVLAIDAKMESDGQWYVYLNGGRLKTDIKAVDWAKQAQDEGAGEILLTSMNNDGTKNDYPESRTLCKGNRGRMQASGVSRKINSSQHSDEPNYGTTRIVHRGGTCRISSYNWCCDVSTNYDTTRFGAGVLVPIEVPGGTSQMALRGDEENDSLHSGDCRQVSGLWGTLCTSQGIESR